MYEGRWYIYGSVHQRPGLEFAKTNLFSAGKNILFVFREFANQVVDHPSAHPYHDGDEDEHDDDVLGLGEVDGDASALPRAASLLVPTKLAVANPVAQQALICQNKLDDIFWIGWLVDQFNQ